MSNYPPQYPPQQHYNPQQPYAQQGQPQTSQPALKASMSYRGDPRNALGASLKGSRGRREWSHGLCGCCSTPGTFCYSLWCPCIVFSKNKSRLEHLRRFNARHLKRGDSCSGDCFLHCCLTTFTTFGWVLQIGTRGDVRDHYRIEGGCCGDCMANWCCSPCALTQEAREIELEEDFQGDQRALLSGV